MHPSFVKCMKKPFPQTMIKAFPIMGAIIVFVVYIQDKLSKTLAWLNIQWALGITAFYLIAYLTFRLLVKYGKIPWASDDGQPLRVKKIGLSFIYALLGLLVLVWTGALIDYFYVTPKPYVKQSPTFRSNSTRNQFKVLILSFDKECQFQDKTYDIGRVIQKRLENLKHTDTINIQTYYYTDSLDLTNFTHEKADSLMKLHHADMILYGSYSLKECEGGTSDKVCFNYQTNINKWHLTELHAQKESKMFNIGGLEDIRKGTGQENIEYVIYFVSAISELKKDHYESAMARFRKIKDFDKKASILFEIGNCYFFKKDRIKAKMNFEKTLRLDPNHAEALAHLGILAADDKQFDAAKTLLIKGMKADPENLCVRRSLAEIYIIHKDTCQAKEQLEKVLRILPNNDALLNEVASTYSKIKEYSRAKELYISSLKIHASHPGTWTSLGNVCKHLQDTAAAIQCFKNALTVNQRDENAWFSMGKLLLEQKDPGKAIAYFNTALEIKPNFEHASAYLALAYMANKQEKEAEACLDHALTIDSLAETVLYSAALLQMRLKNDTAAAKNFETLVRIRPDNLEYWNKLGLLYSKLDRFSEATQCFEKMRQLVPGHGAIYYNLAQMASCQRLEKKTLTYLTRALDLIPDLKINARRDGAFKWLSGNREFLVLIK